VGRVCVFMSMSLDGFVAGPEVSVDRPMGASGERLHAWLDGTDPKDADLAGRMFSPATTGAVIMGRRTFTVGEGPWGADGTFGLPCFVVTHRPADTITRGATTFTFVTGGIDQALADARAAAGAGNINVMGADVVQQMLRAGLVDELHVTLVPILLGDGVRLFDHLSSEQIELERTGVIDSSAVTHLQFRVIPRLPFDDEP
jgi:dihydrofolate reductase